MPLFAPRSALLTNHVLSSNAISADWLLPGLLTSFKLKLLVPLHHLCGHHALNLEGEREGEGEGEGEGERDDNLIA